MCFSRDRIVHRIGTSRELIADGRFQALIARFFGVSDDGAEPDTLSGQIPQPLFLRDQQLVHHLMNLREGTNRCGQWIERNGMINRVFIPLNRCLHDHFLHIDVRSIERGELRR